MTLDRATGVLTAPPAAPRPSESQGRLALAFQEPLTVAARVRQNKVQAPDPGEFRKHVRHLLAQSDTATRQAGYPGDHAKLATYSVVALLDEAILNTSGALRAAWVGYPLQQELFGENVAGENFFLQLRDLLGRSDSQELADLLEVYLLCLLLGFKGRYAAAGGAEVEGLVTAVSQKIQRIRGGVVSLTPQARLPEGEVAPVRRDPWIPRLTRLLALSVLVVIVLAVGYRVLLALGNSATRELAERLIG